MKSNRGRSMDYPEYFGIGTAIAGVVGWFTKRQLSRIDRLEQQQVSKDDLNTVISKINTHVTERTTELKLTTDAAHNRIDAILMQDRTHTRGS